MPTDDKGLQWQSLPPFLLVLILALAAYLEPWPLLGERPPQATGTLAVQGIQPVEARLWQDPFTAVQRHQERQTEKGQKAQPAEPHRDMEWLGQVARDKCEKKADCRPMVLGVMTFGGPYMGMEEFRRRTRYAVLAGLNSHGYSPDDAEHIGYVETKDAWLPKVVPYELLLHESGRPLLLLWLDEDALARDLTQAPARTPTPKGVSARLKVLLQPLIGRCEHCELQFIGPASSGTLLKMAAEPALQRDFLSEAAWHAASPTADGAWEKAKSASLNITRVISRDGQLVDALVAELALRRVGEGDSVALVGQWDTAYSRRLIELLQDRLTARKVDTITAYYLRGLDGEQPGKDKSGKDKADKDGKDKASQIERPEGDAQTDYLRRLVLELKSRHKASHGGGKVRAVGILGDDYHDKLLALQALRHAFPEAVFFTTDLDAAMLHPGDNLHTRNLVVASGFGLALRPEIQGAFPPFRDSYQTAAYIATRVALHNAQAQGRTGELKQDGINLRIPPLLFEIGRGSAVRLNSPPGQAECQGLEDCLDWQPVRNVTPGWRTILGALLALAGGGALIAVLSGRFRRFCRTHKWTLTVGPIVAASLGGSLYLHLPDPLGEPFSWTEGVSVWPTELLRLGAILLAYALFRRGARQLLACDDGAQKQFFFDASALQSARAVAPWSLYRARRLPLAVLDGWLNRGDAYPEPVWKMAMLIRQALRPALLYLLTGLGLMLLLGFPEAPVRGSVMWTLDKITLILAVVGFVLLLFFVLNASWRAVWLAERLEGDSGWPEPTLSRFGWRPGVDKKYFDDYLDVRLIAASTCGVQRLVHYPFLVFFLLVLSRSRIFDAWHVPPALYLVFALALVLMTLATWRLRKTAEGVRERALRKMNDHLLNLQSDAALEAKMKTMLAQVRELRDGAFAPISQEPLVRAILVLFGGISGVVWLEYASLLW